MGRTVVVYQPRYYPKLHYLARAAQSDTFVVFDDVEFSRRSPQQRALIDLASKRWLTIPVRHTGNHTLLTEAEIVTSSPWPTEHRKTLIHKYGSEANAFSRFYDRVTEESDVVLPDFTVPILRELFEEFDVQTEMIRSSDIDVEHPGDPSEYIARLVAAVGGTEYLAGETGYRNYLDEEPFRERGIAIALQDWSPEWEDGNVCSLDVLFNARDPARYVP